MNRSAGPIRRAVHESTSNAGSRQQWEELKLAGSPEDLRRFAQINSCPTFRDSATALAVEREGACRTEMTRFTTFASKGNVVALKQLAERAACPEVKDKVRLVIEKQARDLEDRCATEDAKWAAFTGRSDYAALVKAKADFGCPRIVAEIDVPGIGFPLLSRTTPEIEPCTAQPTRRRSTSGVGP